MEFIACVLFVDLHIYLMYVIDFVNIAMIIVCIRNMSIIKLKRFGASNEPLTNSHPL